MALSTESINELNRMCPIAKRVALGTEAAAAQVVILPYSFQASGNITASIAVSALGLARAAGVVTRAGFTLSETGADTTNALSLEGDVLINGVTIFSTKPALAKTAADGAWTTVAGTGVTVGVINVAADDVAANDVLTCVFTLTRTASPGTEMARLCLYVEVTYPA